MATLELGMWVKDIVTRFEGFVTGRTEYLNGCVQCCVTPRVDKDGKMVDGHWIDENQLKKIGDGITVKKMEKKPVRPDPDD